MREQPHLGRSPTDASGAQAPSCAGAAWRCVVLLEISGFNALRRELGLARSELLSLDVAERAAAALPEAQVATVGRNLVELSLSAASAAGVDAAMAELRAAFAQPICIDDAGLAARITLGIAIAGDPATTSVELLEQAEEELAQARLQASPPAAALPEADDDALVSRDIARAISRDELFLQYQPKLHLRRQAIVSVEALIRWHHPDRGLVLPNHFIPAIERTGDIAAVTLWTMRQAIADQRALRRNGHALPVFINISGVLLSDAAFIEQAIELAQGSGADLGFEITETSVIRDPESAIRHLTEMAAIGVRISIDDYGAGLSSLAYLKQLPARELKIDKLFVTQLTSSHRDPLIVRSTIDLAHALEMEVVAEGVETPTSLALLSVMGCDMVQGFLISRPLALGALLAYVREERHLSIAPAKRSPIERLAAVRAAG